MIFDVLGDLFAVPWFPTPTPSATPEPPNSAELDSVRAAWAGVWVSLGTGIAAFAAAAFAGVAFVLQRKTHLREVLDASARSKSQALAVQPSIVLDGERAMQLQRDEYGQPEHLRFTICVANDSDFPISEASLNFTQPVAFGFDGLAPGQLPAMTEVPLQQVIPAGEKRFYTFDFHERFSDNTSENGWAAAAMSPVLKWTDQQGSRWSTKPGGLARTE